MWYQNSKKVNPFARYGCYFFCLGYIAEKACGKGKLEPEDIWETYTLGCGEGWIEEDCFIISPQKVIEHFLWLLDQGIKWKVSYVGWWNVDKGEEFWDGEMYNYVILRDDHGSYNHFHMEDYEPHFGEPSMPSKGLTGKRYLLVQKVE